MFSDIVFLNNPIIDWIYSILTFFLIIIFRYLLKMLIDNKINDLVKRSKSKLDDILLSATNKFLSFWFFVLWIYFAKSFVVLSSNFDKIVNKSLEILLILVITSIIQNIGSRLISIYSNDKLNPKLKSASSVLRNIISIVVWFIWITVVLSVLWYNISTLAAWIWISGIAVALAIQPTLAWIFAWFSIFADKPFREWDFVIIKGYAWTIKEIWLKSTRMITIKWNEVVFPNTELISLAIENISQRETIRNDLNIWVTYDTSTEKLNKWMAIIKNILKLKKWVNKDNIIVVFKSFWDFSLIISVIYFFEITVQYYDQLEIISEINFEIKNSFEKEKIEFAFPTQTIVMQK